MEEKILRKNSLLELLSELEKYRSENPDMLTVYVTPKAPLPEIPDVLKEKIERIKTITGLVIFSWEKEGDMVILPPFPVKQNEIFYDKIFRTEQLKNLFTTEYTLGIILLHLGEYAIGIFEGDKLILSKCGKRLVRAKHKKGGYSQARFQRIREIQVNQFFDEVYCMLHDKFETHLDKITYVIYGGPKLTIKNFLKRNHFIKKLSEKTLDRILDVKDVNRKALEDILKEVWKTKVLYV